MAPGGSVLLPAVILMLLLCGGALWLLASSIPQTRKHRLGQAAAMVVAFIALITIIQYVIDWSSGSSILAGAAGTADAWARRVPLSTALNVLLVGIALLLIDLETRSNQVPSQPLALIVGLIGFLTLLGYAYKGSADSSLLVGFWTGPGMAVPTSIAFLLISVGILFYNPQRGFMEVVTSQSAGGFLARRLLFAAVVIPATLGWLKLTGERIGLFNESVGAALLISAHMISS